MTNFVAFFLLELKRFFRKRNLIILLILLIILTYFLFLGCNEHKSNLEKANKFKDLEKILYSRLISYTHVSIQGIRLLMIPAQAEILFINSNIISDISSRINTTASLQIFNNLKNRNLFKGNYLINWDFAGMLLLVLSILCLLWGNETLRDKNYLKFLSSFVSQKRAYFYTILSRIILLILTILFLFAAMFLVLNIKNVTFSSAEFNYFTGYILDVIFTSFFFFSAGVLIGFIRSKAAGIITSFAVWFLFLFIIPGMLHFHIVQKADNISSDYQTEFNKIKILTKFENECSEKAGEFNINNIKLERTFIENFWKKYYPKIDAVEEKTKGEIIENIDMYQKLSIFSPTTFYYSICTEISSVGYRSFIEFYSYIQEMKSKFVRFWIDRVYYHDPKVLVNFIKDDENLFHAKSRLPKNFLTGILITLCYVIILFIVSYFLFINSLYKIKKEDIEQLGDVDFKLINGSLFVWIVREDTFRNLLFNLFSGNFKIVSQKGFTGKIVVNGVDIGAEKNKESFIYICRPEFLPDDMRVRDFLDVYAGLLRIPSEEKKTVLKSSTIEPLVNKTFAELTKQQKFYVTLSLLEFKKKQVYLIDDICDGLDDLHALKLKERMDELKDQGALVIYLNNSIAIAEDLENRIYEGDAWLYTVGSVKKRQEFFEGRKEKKTSG